jgi:hypothetical protein
MKKLVIGSAAGVVLFLAGATGVGAEPFLCPVMGHGALNAPGLDGSHKNTVGTLPSGDATIRPGNNRAGENANENALNENGGPSPTNTPGADGFTPIWNP